jgi:hypothetical protein
MRRLPIAPVLLMTFLAMLAISAPGHAATDKAILEIEGMT